ncbi:MAG: hypothetical protein E7262_06875 [Lachnospiraceae bacterium]|nr:hypothetical protein [Lachnospiraceae bacterium]
MNNIYVRNIEGIQRKVINKLLDKYEKSKLFIGTNKVHQNIAIPIGKIVPKYLDDAEYDIYTATNEAVGELETKNFITASRITTSVIDKITLNVENIDLSYKFTKREPKHQLYTWFKEIVTPYIDDNILKHYINEQILRINKGQKIEYYNDDKDDYLALLKLVKELQANEEEIYIRDFSMKIFKDSKRVEKLIPRAQNIMYQYGDFQEKDSVLEECGVVKTPTYVCVKGACKVCMTNQEIDVENLGADIGLSSNTLKQVEGIKVTGSKVITIENLTTFYSYRDDQAMIIYLGGFHNKTKREILKKLYESNADKEYYHFSDIDGGGFYILEHLKKKTDIPFRSLHMDVKTIEEHKHMCKPLTINDKKRIRDLITMLDNKEERENSNNFEDYRDVLKYMLQNNCKLEQEGIKI